MIVSTLCTRVRTYLGTAEDDPQYSNTILLPIAGEAYDALLHDIHELNPGYLATSVTLAAASATSHTYTFSAQSPAITDFAGWLDVRDTDSTGTRFREVRYDELNYGGDTVFALTGMDDSPTLITSPDVDAGLALYLLYVQWPAAISVVGDSPAKIPTRYHDVVALEMASIAFGLGGEQRMPPELFARWQDRRGQLMQSVSRRGSDLSSMRLDPRKEF